MYIVSELAKRVLVGVPAAAFLLWMVWLGERPFEILMGIIAMITLWEVHNILIKAHMPDIFPLTILIAAGAWLLPYLPGWGALTGGSVIIVVTVWAIFDLKTDTSSRWLSTLFCGVYVPVGFLMVVNIRGLGSAIEGFWLLVSFLLMIWGNDIFAYFGGKKFGKHPLAPSVSPKKTWEGFWIGFFGSGVGLAIAWWLANPYPASFLTVLPAAVVVSILGPAGDLLESRLKRLAGVKDSSNLLPGHGGLFDRFDALLLSSPFVFFYFYILNITS